MTSTVLPEHRFPTFGRWWRGLRTRSGRVEVAKFIVGGVAAIAILVGAYRLMEAFAFGPTMMRDEVPIWGWIVLASPVIVVLGAPVGVLWSKRLRSFGIGALTSVGLTFVVGVLFG